jgi:cytoskeletal protein CcmA (bactofilin family)
MAMFNKGATAQVGSDEVAAPQQQPVSTPSSSNANPVPNAESAVSTIAHDMKIVGDVSCSGVIRIEGNVEGSVKGARQVLVGRQGMVKGDVSAREAIIGGKIEGSVTASERVEVQGTALINGDLYAKSMLVQEGGRINGAIRMEESSGQRNHASQTGPVAVVR